MSGIIGTVNVKNNHLEEESDLIIDSYSNSNIFIERRTIQKFEDDKVFMETNEYVFILEGVILNKNELLLISKKESWRETLKELISANNISFFEHFRGSFSGVIYFKQDHSITLFTDQIGSKPFYYYEKNNEIIFASEIQYIIDLMIANGIKYESDEKGIYSLLTHGYMLDDLTLFSKTKHLKAGCYLRILNNNTSVTRYHLFDNTPNYNMPEEEIVEELDRLFNIAVERQVNKNREYKYKNYAPLSAGLDSRMTTWVLSQKVKDIVNITYSQSNYLDEIIPKAISAELKTHLIFKPLDNGLSLFFLDEMVRTNTSVLYGGPAQVWDTFNLLNLSKVGVIHTGMLGDVVVGTFYKSLDKDKVVDIQSGAYSTRLINEFKTKLDNYDIEAYKNEEIFNFYNRGFNGANMGSPLIFQEYTESFSPFYDLDVLEFCLTIPMELRWGHNIYDKWVLTKYPEAARYPHNGRKITKNKGKNYSLFGKYFTLDTLLHKGFKYFLRKIGIVKNSMQTKEHMNPFDYWYHENKDLKEFMDTYYKTNLELINDKSLKSNITNMYKNGSTIEKTQVLTLLSVYKHYFSDAIK